MKNFKNINRSGGYAALLTIFVLGIVALFVTFSLVNKGYLESITSKSYNDSLKAFYFANSGIDDAVARININPDFGKGAAEKYEIKFSDSERISVEIVGDDTQRQIKSVGYNGKYIRKTTANFINTSIPGDNFIKVIHAGTQGLSLMGNTLITSLDGSGGNVYSNSFIIGKSSGQNADGSCKSSADEIDGTVWAHEFIGKTESGGDGVCIDRDAYAKNFEYCYVGGDVYTPNIIPGSCAYKGIIHNETEPALLPLPEFGEDVMKNYLEDLTKPVDEGGNGKRFDSCVIGGVPDCTGGTGKIGEAIIDNDFIVLSNKTFTVDGPIYVKGNIIFNSNITVNLDPSVANISQIMLADKKIKSGADVKFGVNTTPLGKAYLLFISTEVPTVAKYCDDPSITMSSNVNSVLFFAKHGCILVNSNSIFNGSLLAEAVVIDANSQISFDPELGTAMFGLSKDGGWKIVSFSED